MGQSKSKLVYETLMKNKIEIQPPVEMLRNGWEKLALQVHIPEEIIIEKRTIEGINTEWISHSNAEDKKVIQYFHGGGFVAGSCVTHRELASKISLVTGIKVILFDYKLSPENKYPAALEDSKTLYNWICANHTTPENIIFAGDSAGGGLVVSTLLSLRENKTVLPKAAILLSPWLDLTCSGESYKKNKEIDPIATVDGLRYDIESYLGNNDPASPIVSPIFAELSNLPSMLIHVGEKEMLLSDSLKFAERCKMFDVKIELKVWQKMWHVFHAFNIDEAEEAINEIAIFLNELSVSKP